MQASRSRRMAKRQDKVLQLLKNSPPPKKSQQQKESFDGKLFCNLAFFARLRTQSRTPPAYAAGRRGACLHRAFSIAVGPTRFDTALRSAARLLNFSTSWQGLDTPTPAHETVPAASRSARAQDRAFKIFVILQKTQDYNIDIMVARRVSRTEKPRTTRTSAMNDPGTAR